MDTIHMAETTSPRLMAAAKEFNIGKETLVDFLIGKGFSKDDLKPTAKLTEDMYRSLQQEFQGDKVAKIKSNQIDLPKGSVEAKRKKEDETVLFRKDPNKKPVKEEPAPVVVEEVKPVVVVKVEEPKKEPETIKIEAPEIEGPKIIDKIDLSQIDSSTRPKKTAKRNPGLRRTRTRTNRRRKRRSRKSPLRIRNSTKSSQSGQGTLKISPKKSTVLSIRA